jgi:NADH-quinone oxidoreductase subunit A
LTLETVQEPFWPLILYFAAVIILVAGMIAASYVLGQRHRQRATHLPYESGITPTGAAHLRYGIDFYLVAMFFVIFDLESIFIFAWAVAVRKTGWAGYAEILVFIGVLAAALLYLWRVGALDWGNTRRPKAAKPVGG